MGVRPVRGLPVLGRQGGHIGNSTTYLEPTFIPSVSRSVPSETSVIGVENRSTRGWVKREVGIGPYLFEYFGLGRAESRTVVN